MIWCAWIATFAGCGSLLPHNPLAATCAEKTCYNLEGPAQAECLSRCNSGR